MNKRGHILFALLLLGFAIYVLKSHIMISYAFLLLHLPFYLIGAILPDKIERPSFGNVWHRGFLHSRIMLMLLFFGFIPISLYFTLHHSNFYFFNISYNYWSFTTAILLGWTTHLVGDSLTSKLR